MQGKVNRYIHFTSIRYYAVKVITALEWLIKDITAF